MPPPSASPHFGAWLYPEEVFLERSPGEGLKAAFSLLGENCNAEAVYVQVRPPGVAPLAILQLGEAPPQEAVDRVAEEGSYEQHGRWHLQRLAIGDGLAVVAAFALGETEATEEHLTAIWTMANVICATVATRIRHDVGPRRLDSGDFDLLHDWEIGPVECAVMFADVRGFSQFTQILGSYVETPAATGAVPHPRELVRRFCQAMGEAASHYGWIDKFMGDGVMVVFPLRPASVPDLLRGRPDVACALRAACTALHMRQKVQDIVQQWEDSWISGFRLARNETVSFELAVGISYGTAYRALFGPDWRQDYTVFGDMVVVAKRLEELAGRQDGQSILVSGTLASRLEAANDLVGTDLVTLQRLPPRVLKGTAHRQEIWSVTMRLAEACAGLTDCSLCASGE